MNRVARAVVDVAERDAVVVDARERVAQREDLEAARVGQDRPVPAHEPVQAAELGDQLVAGPEVQVVGVAEQDLRAERRAPRPASSDFTRRLRPDRHERRRLDLAVRGPQHPGPRRPVGRDLEDALRRARRRDVPGDIPTDMADGLGSGHPCQRDRMRHGHRISIASPNE